MINARQGNLSGTIILTRKDLYVLVTFILKHEKQLCDEYCGQDDSSWKDTETVVFGEVGTSRRGMSEEKM